jgi:hypothetical protein
LFEKFFERGAGCGVGWLVSFGGSHFLDHLLNMMRAAMEHETATTGAYKDDYSSKKIVM